MKTHWRFLVAAVLLTGTALLLQARNGVEIIPQRPSLSSLPRTIQVWNSIDRTLDKDVLDKLGPGDFMVRDYYNNTHNQAVSLYMAYFPSQRAGDTIHSPKNCLPGAGWSPLEPTRIPVSLPGHAPFPANRYGIGKGNDRQLVRAWYWAHDQGLASEYWAKLHMVTAP